MGSVFLGGDTYPRKLGHMFIIPFPVLCKCRNQLKRTKTTKIISKDAIKEQRRQKKEQRRHTKSKDNYDGIKRPKTKSKDDIPRAQDKKS